MTSRQQKLGRTDTSVRVPSEVWQVSDDGCDDDAMVRNKDSQDNSDAVDDSWAYDPDFETSEEAELVEEVALENSFTSHETDGLGGNHSSNGELLPDNEVPSPISVNSQSTVASSVSQSDPQTFQHEMSSSDSGSLMQSSIGDSCVTVTPLSPSSTPRKVTFNSYSYPRTVTKHSTLYSENSEISPKQRDSHFAHQRFPETGVKAQNLKFESQSEKNLNSLQFNPRYIASQKSSSSQKQTQTSSQQHFQKDGMYDWSSCSDQECSKEEDHSGSDKSSLDLHVKRNQPAPIKASNRAQSEPRRKVCAASDSFDDSKHLSHKIHNDHTGNYHDFQNDRAERMEMATEASSYLSITGLEKGDRTSKTTESYSIQSQVGDDLRWRNSTEKIMENGKKHSTFDLSLVLSQPELGVLAPQFKPEDLENYSQLSQAMLKEKIIRLAALLQACRDVITWNKEERQQLLAEREALRKEHVEYARNLEEQNKQILNKCEECRNLKAEQNALKEALRKETTEKVTNKGEFKKQVDKLEKEKAKSEEDFIRLLGVAKELKMELRNVRHELVRKEEEMRREMIQKMEEMREEMILNEDQMRLGLMRKEEEMCHEVESLQLMLEKERERHFAEEESLQQELSVYKESIKQKLDEAEQKVAWRMEQLQEECQRYMLSIRQKGKHSKPTTIQEIEQKKDSSTAEHAGSTASMMLSGSGSGRSSAVLVSPLTENPYYQELVSRVNANDNDTVCNQPKRSPMFSCAKSPVTKVRFVSSAGSPGSPLSSRVQISDSSRKSDVEET